MAPRRSRVIAFKRPFRAVPLRNVRNPPPLRFWEPQPPTWRQSLRAMRLWLLVIACITLSAIFYIADRHRRASQPSAVEQVEGPFTRCGYGRGNDCVIDGDTFHIGERTIRVKGIDAAELAGACPAETTQAEASTRALQDWLNRGPFVMTSAQDQPHDKYGRELMAVTRTAADGREEGLADYMTRQGGAHAYDGGARGGWC